MSDYSIKTKLIFLILLISSIFISSSFFIKATNNGVAQDFEQFYNHTFSATTSFDEVKSLQVNVMVNIRGLQIAYLLGLTKQVDGYLNEINTSMKKTPELMSVLERVFVGEPQQIRALDSQITLFHEKSLRFLKAMQESDNNKAPFPVFAAFRDSYVDLGKQFDVLTKLNIQNADVSYAAINEAIVKSSWVFYLSIMFALSVAVIVAIIFSNRMIRSIRHVKDVAISLSKGDLTKRCKVDGHDEIGELSEALNTTTENLRTTMASISESANVVAKNSEVMLVANTDIQNAVQEVSDNNVQSVAAIEEMTATSKDIANNIAETAQTSEEMTSLANKGIVSSKTTKDSVENLVSNLDKTSIVVSQVREESSKIESILDVIRGISEQTNLLALNAAIEAARAGEQGRGFAVVADEVRGLAQRSQLSVNEIESMLSELQGACSNAVDMMAASTETATSTESLVIESNQLIENILDMMQQVNAKTQQIATAAEEQSSVSVGISSNMYTVQALSDKAAQVSAEAVNYSHELNAISQQVDKEVRFFELT